MDKKDIFAAPALQKPEKGEKGDRGEQGQRGPSGQEVTSDFNHSQNHYNDLRLRCQNEKLTEIETLTMSTVWRLNSALNCAVCLKALLTLQVLRKVYLFLLLLFFILRFIDMLFNIMSV